MGTKSPPKKIPGHRIRPPGGSTILGGLMVRTFFHPVVSFFFRFRYTIWPPKSKIQNLAPAATMHDNLAPRRYIIWWGWVADWFSFLLLLTTMASKRYQPTLLAARSNAPVGCAAPITHLATARTGRWIATAERGRRGTVRSVFVISIFAAVFVVVLFWFVAVFFRFVFNSKKST